MLAYWNSFKHELFLSSKRSHRYPSAQFLKFAWILCLRKCDRLSLGRGKVSPWELQLVTEEGALFCHFMQNKETWSKWVRLKHIYPTDRLAHIWKQFILTQLSFKVGTCTCVCICICIYSFPGFSASNQGILCEYFRSWIQPLLLQITAFANQVKKITQIGRYAVFSL